MNVDNLTLDDELDDEGDLIVSIAGDGAEYINRDDAIKIMDHLRDIFGIHVMELLNHRSNSADG